MSKHTWNHRVVVHTLDGITGFSLHEVHYEDDKAVAVTQHPCDLGFADSVDELRWTLAKMLEALDQPVLNYEDF